MGIIGVLVIVVGLLISVALHECGHMIPAKKFGVYVPEFAVGFGPQIFGVKKGETTYSLRAILLGGYVRLVGMFAPARDGVKTTNRRGKPTLAQEAREASMEEIPEGFGSRAFYLLHPAQKIIVMISGPLVNLFLSILFLSIALVGIGIPEASLTLSEVPQQLTTQGATVDAPAYAAGIRAGDTITGVNGSAVTSWEQMRQNIAGSQGSIDIDYLRNGQLFHVKVDPLRSGDSVSIGVIAGTEYQAASVGTVASAVGETFTGTVSVVARLPIALWDVGRSIFTGAPRDSGGVMSVVGIGRIAADATSSDVTASSGGWMLSAARPCSGTWKRSAATGRYCAAYATDIHDGHYFGSDDGPADDCRHRRANQPAIGRSQHCELSSVFISLWLARVPAAYKWEIMTR